ncbi:hypothetical protein [Burkholderia sp. TSV86]|uniref:hypothetical protein n=1 Tax=Burkholderia sp. TSV86 TaxID=1385594 RepID=UPI0012E3960C|nr:hypothetical protein [Burkholderia sp. TSV86]
MIAIDERKIAHWNMTEHIREWLVALAWCLCLSAFFTISTSAVAERVCANLGLDNRPATNKGFKGFWECGIMGKCGAKYTCWEKSANRGSDIMTYPIIFQLDEEAISQRADYNHIILTQ